MIADPTYPLFPICAFVGFVGCLIPFPWHLQSMNSGTCFFMFWTSLACLNYFVNSLIWVDNAINSAPVWCDISIRIIMATTVGLPMSSLCIVRRLYKITKVQAVSISPSEKRRAVLLDCLLCGLFPLLFIALQYVVQGHRFNIYEGIGCMPAIYNTPLMYFTTAMWPVVLGSCSAVYCALTLHQFYRRRLQFAQFLHSGSSLNASRYLRLMALALTEMLISTPLGIFGIVMNATATPVGPWRSWADTHLDYGRVEQFPAIIWRKQSLLIVSFETSRWQAPFSAFVFIAFFCFAEEARKHYKIAFDALCKRLGLKTAIDTSKLRAFQLPHPKWSKAKLAGESAGSLPVWRPAKDGHAPFGSEKTALESGKDAFNIRKEAFMSSSNAASSFSFDAVRGVMLPSSPATTAPPPEYSSPGFQTKDLPPLPFSHPDVPLSPCTSGSTSSSSSSPRTSTDLSDFTFHQLPSRSVVHTQSQSSLRSAAPSLPQPAPASASLCSIAPSTRSDGVSDVIYIYDAYSSDSPLPSRAPSPPPSSAVPPPRSTSLSPPATRSSSPPPFSNLLPAPSPIAEPARSLASRPPTPLMPLPVKTGEDAV